MLAFVQIFIHLRPAFSRASTFYRALIVVLAMGLKPDKEGGVTPLVHALPFKDPGTAYGRLLGFFSSTAFDLQELCDRWFTVLITIFKPFLVRIGEHAIIVIDEIYIAKQTDTMAGAQTLQRSSKSNSKKERIIGHCFQVAGLLVCWPFLEPKVIGLIARIGLGTKGLGEEEDATKPYTIKL